MINECDASYIGFGYFKINFLVSSLLANDYLCAWSPGDGNRLTMYIVNFQCIHVYNF